MPNTTTTEFFSMIYLLEKIGRNFALCKLSSQEFVRNLNMCKEKYKLLDKSPRGLNLALLGHQPRAKYPKPCTPCMDQE
jgi:hypothetical protein